MAAWANVSHELTRIVEFLAEQEIAENRWTRDERGSGHILRRMLHAGYRMVETCGKLSARHD